MFYTYKISELSSKNNHTIMEENYVTILCTISFIYFNNFYIMMGEGKIRFFLILKYCFGAKWTMKFPVP